MKKLFFALICCFTATWCLANDGGDDKNYKYSQERKIDKVYDVQPNCELEMDGIHSDYIITTWDQPQISFEVKVLVRSDKEKAVKYLIDIINVEFVQEGDLVRARTVFENKTNRSFNASVSIKYYVKVPEDVRMDLETRYGDIIVETVKKDFKAEVKYGSLTAGNLLADNEIEIKYGDFSIAYAKNLELDMKYSDGKINKVEFIDADIEYSDFTSTEVVKGVFENEYSDIRIENANDVKAKNRSSDMKIANLTQKLNVDAKHSPLTVTVGAIKPEIYIKGQYSDVKLNVNENSVFKYDVRTTYGDIICGDVMGSNAGKISEGRIAGKHGDGGAGSIKAELQYGDFRIE